MNQLLEKIDRHVGQMSPHIRERLTAQLLIEARDRLRQLQFEQGSRLVPFRFSYNPDHPLGTCGQCGAELVHNVPRLGNAGGFVHKSSGKVQCDMAPVDVSTSEIRAGGGE